MAHLFIPEFCTFLSQKKIWDQQPYRAYDLLFKWMMHSYKYSKNDLQEEEFRSSGEESTDPEPDDDTDTEEVQKLCKTPLKHPPHGIESV